MRRHSINAVIYARYSSSSQKDASIEQQIRDIREFAERNDIQIVNEYCDHKLSGRTDNRPEFLRMIKDSAKKRFQLVLVWKVDRFARNRYDAAMHKYKLKKNDVRVIYVKESIPEGPEGILLESILEGSAEYYSANLAQNVRRGMRDNALKAKVNQGNLPYGYRASADGKYEINPDQAPIVKEVFQSYAEGMMLQTIIANLNARGILTGQGKPWNKNSFHRMFTNERYTGVYIYDDIRIEGGIPQLITKEQFEVVQKRRASNRHTPAAGRSVDVDYILTAKLFCGHCGRSMVGDSGTSKSGKTYYYSCIGKKRKLGCAKTSIKKDWIEDLVVKITAEYVLQDEIIDKIADAAMKLQAKDRDKGMLFALKKQIRDTKKAISNIMTAIEQGIYTTSTQARLEQLEEQKTRLTISIEKEMIEAPALSRDEIIFWMNRFRKGKVDDKTYRCFIIDAFVNAVYVYDDDIRIVYNFCDEKHEIKYSIVDECPPDGPGECSALACVALPFIPLAILQQC